MPEYPLSNYTSPDLALAAAIGDTLFSCSARRSNLLLSEWHRRLVTSSTTSMRPASYRRQLSVRCSARVRVVVPVPSELLAVAAVYRRSARAGRCDEGRLDAICQERTGECAGCATLAEVRRAQGRGTLAGAARPVIETDFAAVHHCTFRHALEVVQSGQRVRPPSITSGASPRARTGGGRDWTRPPRSHVCQARRPRPFVAGSSERTPAAANRS